MIVIITEIFQVFTINFNAGINSEYQANSCYLAVLLNAFIGPKPVKTNGNLFDGGTLKNTH